MKTDYSTLLTKLTIGKRLRMFRIINGFSQEELGDKLGYSPKTISAYENDEREISLSACDHICELFKIPKAYFLCGDNLESIDANTRKKMDDYIESEIWNNSAATVTENCKKMLEGDKIPVKKEYLPMFNYDEKTVLSCGLFDINSLPIKKRDGYNEPKRIDFDIEAKKQYLYDVSALAKNKLYDIIKKGNYQVELKNLKECDSLDFFKFTLEKMKNTKYTSNSGNLWDPKEKDISVEYIQKQLNEVLENLSPSLDNYWHIIAFLIENGAYYTKEHTYGDDITITENIKDISKTNLVYRYAKDSTKNK